MTRPIVAISVELLEAPYYEGNKRCQLFHAYLDCIREAGLTPMLVPPDSSDTELSTLLRQVDGILLTGGDDIDLTLINGPKPLDVCKPVPHAQQKGVFSLIEHAVAKQMPLLGICLGMQMIGVYHGGTLIQHLRQHKKHTAGTPHNVKITKKGKLGKMVGTSDFEVLSYHHQGFDELKKPINVVGHAADGTIEAIEHAEHPFMIGVQWHPEKTPQSLSSKLLFKGFATAIKKYQSNRLNKRNDSF